MKNINTTLLRNNKVIWYTRNALKNVESRIQILLLSYIVLRNVTFDSDSASILAHNCTCKVENRKYLVNYAKKQGSELN